MHKIRARILVIFLMCVFFAIGCEKIKEATKTTPTLKVGNATIELSEYWELFAYSWGIKLKIPGEAKLPNNEKCEVYLYVYCLDKEYWIECRGTWEESRKCENKIKPRSGKFDKQSILYQYCLNSAKGGK